MPVASCQGQLLTTAEEDRADGCLRLSVTGCFWTLLEIFAFFIWIWLLIIVFTDIFRSRDLSGVAKTLWVVFVLIVPLLGILIYLIARGGSMHERAAAQVQRQDEAFRAYVQQTAGAPSVTDELDQPGQPQGLRGYHRRRVSGGERENARLSFDRITSSRAEGRSEPQRRLPGPSAHVRQGDHRIVANSPSKNRQTVTSPPASATPGTDVLPAGRPEQPDGGFPPIAD